MGAEAEAWGLVRGGECVQVLEGEVFGLALDGGEKDFESLARLVELEQGVVAPLYHRGVTSRFHVRHNTTGTLNPQLISKTRITHIDELNTHSLKAENGTQEGTKEEASLSESESGSGWRSRS